MKLLDQILEENQEFVRHRDTPMTSSPRKRIAIFTCMDTRLVEFLEPAMGLHRGDAKIIKNAGNTLLHPDGGVIRSLVVALFVLGCEEIFVIGHRDCGMTAIDEEKLRSAMLARGITAEKLDSLQPSLKEWCGAFHDPEGNVVRVTRDMQKNELIPKDVPVHGLIFDPFSGKLSLLVNGYEDRAA
jgi:carbonic anhydrase